MLHISRGDCKIFHSHAAYSQWCTGDDAVSESDVYDSAGMLLCHLSSTLRTSCFSFSRHGKTKALLVHSAVCFLGICLPLRKLPLSHHYLSASPRRDLWRLTSPVKSTRKHWTITPAYFTKLSPILLFHSGLLSTQPHLISTLLMWQSEAASLSRAKWHERHVGILLVACFFCRSHWPLLCRWFS